MLDQISPIIQLWENPVKFFYKRNLFESYIRKAAENVNCYEFQGEKVIPLWFLVINILCQTLKIKHE